MELKSNCKRLKALVDKTEFKENEVLNMDLYNQTTNKEISQCLTEPHHNSQRLFDGLRIRKLTPKECWRLMGFDDEDFEKAEKVNSNTQLYKQAGNSIVVQCLEGIIKNLNIDKHIKVLELFGGIGACSKAIERLNIDYEIADYVEIDKYACKSFNAMHGTNFEPQDITTWNKDIEVDLIMHGSPCQDFSLAGKQAGGDKDSGTRSSLMYETIRIVEKLKPKYVIWENVKNLLNKKHRHNFDAYLETMEQLGYKNYYQVLNAKDYGIPQNRERVFTISILNDDNYVFPKGNNCTNKIDMVEIQQKVKVRKYEVDTEKLKSILRSHKNISNKVISETLNKPLTLVEHWFRKDNCFSIPDADIWFELKKLLNIETNEFDEVITTFEEKDNVYEKSNRFYYDTGLAPTITSASANEKIIQTFTFPPKQELKLKLKDMLEEDVDEKYYLSDEMIDKIKLSDFAQEKSRIQEKEYCDTLLARDYKDPKCVEVIRKYGVFDTEKSKHQAGSVYDENGLAPTLDTMQGGYRQPCVEINDDTFVSKKYDNFIDKNGYIPKMFNPYNEMEIKDIAPTQTTSCNSTTSSATVLIAENKWDDLD